MNLKNFWWHLPGVTIFTEQVIETLRYGSTAVICLPKHVPDGIQNLIASEIKEMMVWSVYDPNLSDFAPHIQLYDQFVNNDDELRNVNTLAINEKFQQQCIWIEGFENNEQWTAWKSFFERYELASRNVDSYERTIFCVLLRGDFCIHAPKEELFLSVHKWEKVLDSSDMLYFATQCFSNSTIDSFYLELAIQITTKIAIWDYDVYIQLAKLNSLEDILALEKNLEILANERQWNQPIPELKVEQWCLGFYDHDQLSPIIYNVQNNTHYIKRLLWSAELHILFPLIEETRLTIIEKFSVVLEKFKDKKSSIYDIEIGFLYKIIKENISLFNNNKSLKSLTYKLKEIRNQLAHLDPVDNEYLFAKEIKNVKNILNTL